MMKHAAAVLLLFAFASVAMADDVDVVKGLQNLSQIHRIANVLELRRTLAHSLPLQVPADPWGTPYRVSESPAGYRVVGAGSDKAFDETVALTRQQFIGLSGDVVFEDGRLVRSNRNWLHSQSGDVAAPSSSALKELDQAELDFMMMRVPIMRSLIGAKATVNTMQLAATHVEEKKTAPPAELSYDAWGTPLQVTINEDGTYRIVSAAADRTFDTDSWLRPASPDFAEDLIYENGSLVRFVDQKQALMNAKIEGVAVPQPPDVSLAGKGRWVRTEPPIVAPVAIERVEPAYPEDYRRARVSGLVILEVAISETGKVEHVGVIKSLGSGLDMAAVAAVRQWKFKPATRNGKAVPVLFNLTINFKLK
ncbi:MAG TPA: energy transducer TonB [Thermoanaerobaculia bacterium]|nr:energy transducer TonB [Thermoanaerobaculia bacterium]